jgi:hypothetical protein
MSSSVTDVSAFTSPVVIPADGDSRNAASVNAAFQALADRGRFLLNSLVGNMQWSGGAYSASGSGLGVFVTPPKNLVIGTSLLSLSADAEVPAATLTAGAFAYLYAFDTAGVLTLQASLDAPDAARAWKSTGDLTHRYLATIKMNATTTVHPFERRGGITLWRNALATRTVLSAQSDLSATGIDCSTWAPPHARMLKLLVKLTNTTGGGTMSLYRTGDAAVPVVLTVEDAGSVTVEVTVPCNSAQSVTYLVSNADTAATVSVLGWVE